MKVALSAGHNPAAQGASFGTLTEHVSALQWIEHITPALEAFGIDVFPVPTGSLALKVAAINHARPDLAIELHFNSDPRHQGRGCETLFAPGSPRGERLARAVQAQMAAVLPPDRGVKEGWYRMDRPGHADYPGDVEGDEVIDAFLRLTNCPAIIVEPCFIHEPEVCTQAAVAAVALARGVAVYAHE